MASVYSTGQQAVSATPASDMRTKLDTAILAHPNWSLIEAISITGGTSRVYKCSGSGLNANSAGKDFYIALTILTASTTVLRFQTFESYTPAATSQAVRSVRSSGTASTPAPSGGGFTPGDTGYTLDISATSTLDQKSVTMDTTNTWDYMIQVSKSRLHVSLPRATFGYIGGVYVLNPRAVSSYSGFHPLFVMSYSVSSALWMGSTSGQNGVEFSRNFLSGQGMQQGGLAGSSPNSVGSLRVAGAYLDPIEGVARGTGIVVLGSQTASTSVASQAGGSLRGSLPGLYGFLVDGSSQPGAQDLIQLSNGQRLACAFQSGNAQPFIDVDTDY